MKARRASLKRNDKIARKEIFQGLRQLPGGDELEELFRLKRPALSAYVRIIYEFKKNVR
jgi:hypothetical protein